MQDEYSAFVRTLEEKKRVSESGVEFWYGRELIGILGYAEWRSFASVIDKAMIACKESDQKVDYHFARTHKMVEIGSGALRESEDWFLGRYACYLIAMNADSTKPQVSLAMTYFAGQTRKQELQDQLTDEQRRLSARLRIIDHTKVLNGVAKTAGVQNFAFFHDAGYRGLYGMGLSDVKKYKGLAQTQDLLDHAGRLELAANDLRITLAEERIRRGKTRDESSAISTHKGVGEEVRAVVTKGNGISLEDLKPEPSIGRLVAKHKRELKKATTKRIGSSPSNNDDLKPKN